MTEMIDNGFTIKSACNLSGYSRSLVYYKAKRGTLFWIKK